MIDKYDIAAIRFGYGHRPGQSTPRDGRGLLDDLEAAPQIPKALTGLRSAERVARFHAFNQERAAQTSVAERRKVGQRLHGDLYSHYHEDTHKRLMVAVTSPHGFFERLVAFWSNHFTVSASRLQAAALVGPFEVEAIRPHILGRFRDMLSAVVRHPAMLIYLDQTSSIGPNSELAHSRPDLGLNENLAREILELHTLGVNGGYTQTDVTQFARLLTGFSVEPVAVEGFLFQHDRAEPGEKHLLGKVYGGGIGQEKEVQQALDDLAAHPSTARFIANKLARHFVADHPPRDLIKALETVFLENGGDLPSLYRVLVEHRESWNLFGRKVKTPFDFVVSGLRAVGARAKQLAPQPGDPKKDMQMNRNVMRSRPNKLAVGSLTVLNQPIKKAPGPDGWPDEAESWIHPQGISGRLEWALAVARKFPQADPVEFLRNTLGSFTNERIMRVIEGAESREEAVALVLASPEFNRR